MEKEATDSGVGSGALPWKSGASTLAYFRPTANKGSLLRPLSQAYNLKRSVKPSIYESPAWRSQRHRMRTPGGEGRRGGGYVFGVVMHRFSYYTPPQIQYSETRIPVVEHACVLAMNCDYIKRHNNDIRYKPKVFLL